MGAGASLQPNMNEAYLREYAGDEFDQAKYIALRDEKGEVHQSILMATVTEGIPAEVFMTYMSYCPSGLMSLYAYVTIIRNAKFLSKSCNRPTAEKYFHAARFLTERGQGERCINYFTFVTDVLPLIAQQRETTTDQLYDKLAFIELGTGVELVPTIVDIKPQSLAASLYMATGAVATNSEKNNSDEVTPPLDTPAKVEPKKEMVEQNRAATLMQKKARGRNAKRQVEEMREVLLLPNIEIRSVFIIYLTTLYIFMIWYISLIHSIIYRSKIFVARRRALPNRSIRKPKPLPLTSPLP
jgi:hypothetical protein